MVTAGVASLGTGFVLPTMQTLEAVVAQVLVVLPGTAVVGHLLGFRQGVHERRVEIQGAVAGLDERRTVVAVR
jgi:hypothetical protein